MAAIPDKKFKTVEEYLAALPPEAKILLEALRNTIKQAAPGADELISYNMPAFRFHGMLVYYAAHKNHIGFYPGSSVVNDIFRDNLAGYKTSKGTIQFPIDKPIPHSLIKNIIRYRMKQNLEREKSKLKKK